MPRIAKELSALAVKSLKHPDPSDIKPFKVAVGGVSGFMLQISPSSAKSWLLRTVVGVKRREIGLGSYPEVSLQDARNRAREMKDKIRQGIDPVAERKSTRAALVMAQSRGLTFADAVDQCLESKLQQFKNEKHKKQWRSTLDTYAAPVIGKMLVADIEMQDVLRVLEPVWATKTETATRLRQRIEGVLSWATVKGHRTGDNPARWAGNLKEILPTPSKVANAGHHAALQLKDAPLWFAALKKRDGLAARALEFLTLTAARSGEVRGAKWPEIDFEQKLWIVPAARMKAGREHRVPLTPEALAVLKAVPRTGDFIFAAHRGGALSDMTISAVMRRMQEDEVKAGRKGWVDGKSGDPAVPHGLRSTFRDWCAEKTEYPRDMAEMALAHTVGSDVERAYRRGDMIEKRRAMLQDWAHFLKGKK